MIRLFIAFLLSCSIVALPVRAADEQMDKADLPGGKPKGPVKPLPSKLPGPSPLDVPAETKPAEAPLTAPPPEVCKRLVTATLVSFNRAIQSKSFTAFHIESLSKPFADAYPADKLLETFTPFISAGANLGGVEAVDPELDPAPVVENNLLKLKGVYRTRPMLVLFDFDYANEAGAWKVNAMTVNLKGTPPPMKTAAATPGGAGVPTEAELAKLVTDTIVDFNTAIQAGGAFESLLAKASMPMKFQMKPQQMKEAFASFIENKTDLSAVASAQPQFDGPPKIEAGKHLIVSGHYRVLPLFVLFNAEYWREGNQWRLLALSVNTIAPSEYKRGAAIRGDAPAEQEKTPVPAAAPKPADKKLPPLSGGDGAAGEDMKMKKEQ